MSSLLEPADQLHFPAGPAYASMTIVERMLEVVRRQQLQGQPTTITDFKEAEETCDLTVGQLTDNIGVVKQMMNREVIRHDQPARPLWPWEADLDYRRERVERAARLIAGAPQLGDPDMFAVLRQSGYSARELGALWKEILLEAAAIVRGDRKFAVS